MATYHTTDGTIISDVEYHHETERQLFSKMTDPEMIKSFLGECHPELTTTTIPENLMDEFHKYIFDTVHKMMETKYICVN